jgi:hypothetical protein
MLIVTPPINRSLRYQSNELTYWIVTIPTEIILPNHQGTVIARVTLGATIYLADPGHWARGAAAQLARELLASDAGGELAYYTTSNMMQWRAFTRDARTELPLEIELPWAGRPRDGLEIRLGDDPTPSVGLLYQEVDGAKCPRAGVIQLFVGPDADPHLLFELLMSAERLGPIYSAVGGWCASPHPSSALRSTAFWQFYEWSQRYLALDIQDPEIFAWHAATGISSANWLTLVGQPLLDAIGADRQFVRPARAIRDTLVVESERSVLIRSSESPLIGDCNQMQYPSHIAKISQCLSSLYAPDEFEYWGGFEAERATARWRTRFMDPHRWL